MMHYRRYLLGCALVSLALASSICLALQGGSPLPWIVNLKKDMTDSAKLNALSLGLEQTGRTLNAKLDDELAKARKAKIVESVEQLVYLHPAGHYDAKVLKQVNLECIVPAMGEVHIVEGGLLKADTKEIARVSDFCGTRDADLIGITIDPWNYNGRVADLLNFYRADDLAQRNGFKIAGVRGDQYIHASFLPNVQDVSGLIRLRIFVKYRN